MCPQPTQSQVEKFSKIWALAPPVHSFRENNSEKNTAKPKLAFRASDGRSPETIEIVIRANPYLNRVLLLGKYRFRVHCVAFGLFCPIGFVSAPLIAHDFPRAYMHVYAVATAFQSLDGKASSLFERRARALSYSPRRQKYRMSKLLFRFRFVISHA